MAVSAVDVAVGALRTVGAFAPYDVNPDPSDLAITLSYLDKILAEKVGTEQLWFFVPETVTAALDQGIGEYYLNDITGTIEFQFVRGIKLLKTNGEEVPVTLIRRETYEEFRNDTCFDNPGEVQYAYVERNDNPKIFLFPSPSDGDMSLKIWGQVYSNKIRTACNGVQTIGFSDAWDLCLETELSVIIGRGAVVDIGAGKREELARAAKDKWELLVSRNTRENVTKPRCVKPRDF